MIDGLLRKEKTHMLLREDEHGIVEENIAAMLTQHLKSSEIPRAGRRRGILPVLETSEGTQSHKHVSFRPLVSRTVKG